uniref:HAT C-terminal dimerisation domain-containing protein n=1 Tax=Brassica oleracea var. oleracea TaxID=109376 RepID=A0A0D3AXL1_BRAOL
MGFWFMARLDFEMGFWFMARLTVCDIALSLMDIFSLSNDDDYVSDNGDSEQEMDENKHVVDESLMSTAEGFYEFFSQQAGTRKSALDLYLSEPVLDMVANKKLDVLKYWRDNANRFKELSRMACDILCIPITTVSSESSFSVGSQVLSKYMSRLLPSNVQALICAINWLRGFEVIAGCDLDEEDQEDANEEAEGNGRKKKTRHN